MDETVRKILQGTRDLLADPARHTTGANARDKSGKVVDVGSADAVCFCFVGGMERAAHNIDPKLVRCWLWGEQGSALERAATAVDRAITRAVHVDHWGSVNRVDVNECDVPILAEDGATLKGHAAVLRVLDVALQS